MRVLLAFNGTRGDIQPAVVVGSELRRRGHDVIFGAPPNMCGFVAAAGLEARPFGYDTRAHMNSDLVRNGLRTGGPRRRLKALAEIRDLGWTQMVSEMSELSQGVDAILTGYVTEQIALPYADALGIPCISLHHAPIRPNRAVAPVPGVPPKLNAAAWWFVQNVMWLLTRGRQHRLRRDLGLPGTAARSHRGALEIQAYDPKLCPELVEEWSPSSRPFVGFLNLSDQQRSRIGADRSDDATLIDWIDSGPAPVYFGFGSMPVPDPAAIVSAIVEACAQLGVRALISSGWNDLNVAQDTDVRLVDALDHDRIFPRCRAVVHHGGAGTTAAALRAGVPSVVCWVGSDQPYWGAQCVRHGVGASTRLKGLTTTTMVDQLTVALTPESAERARQLATELVAAEQALAHCADLVEQCVGALTEPECSAR